MQFDPLQGKWKPKPKAILKKSRMAIQGAITHLKVKFGNFKGPNKKNPDCHVAKLEVAWQASKLA